MHPKVISGEITEDEAFLEFLANFGDKNNDGKITIVDPLVNIETTPISATSIANFSLNTQGSTGVFVGIASTTNGLSTLFFTGIGTGTYHSFETNYDSIIGNIWIIQYYIVYLLCNQYIIENQIKHGLHT